MGGNSVGRGECTLSAHLQTMVADPDKSKAYFEAL